MTRTKQQFGMPYLNDAQGDMSKKWFVEYYYYSEDNKRMSVRIYKGLCTGTADERHRNAQKIIDDANLFLQSETYLTAEPKPKKMCVTN